AATNRGKPRGAARRAAGRELSHWWPVVTKEGSRPFSAKSRSVAARIMEHRTASSPEGKSDIAHPSRFATELATAMIEFFDYLPSPNALKVRTLLRLLQTLPFSTFVSIFEGHGKRPEYQRTNPTGAVPPIPLADGRALAESNATLPYLAEGSVYMPADPFERA